MTFVLDASALVKLFAEQEGSQAFRDWYVQNASQAKLGPHLLWCEVGRVLQKVDRGSSAAALAEMHRRVMAGIDLRPVAEALAWKHAASSTFYDAQYVALADGEGATLVTCDRRMEKAGKDAGVPVVLL